MAETDGEGDLLAAYGWVDALLSQTREGKTSTYLYDGDGNVRGLLDEEGNLGHHTTIANTMLGRGTEINMNMYTQQLPSATDIYWSKKWYEIGKKVIKVKE